MAQAVLVHVLEELQSLELEELRQVQRAIEAKLTPHSYAPEEERFLQSLLDEGVIGEIKRSITAPQERAPLIEVAGKPVSETIIEERR